MSDSGFRAFLNMKCIGPGAPICDLGVIHFRISRIFQAASFIMMLAVGPIPAAEHPKGNPISSHLLGSPGMRSDDSNEGAFDTRFPCEARRDLIGTSWIFMGTLLGGAGGFQAGRQWGVADKEGTAVVGALSGSLGGMILGALAGNWAAPRCKDLRWLPRDIGPAEERHPEVRRYLDCTRRGIAARDGLIYGVGLTCAIGGGIAGAVLVARRDDLVGYASTAGMFIGMATGAMLGGLLGQLASVCGPAPRREDLVPESETGTDLPR